MKRTLIWLLIATLLLPCLVTGCNINLTPSLGAVTTNNETSLETTPTQTNPEKPFTVYTVIVVDENNTPLVGADVQLFIGDWCRLPVSTNAQGIATITTDSANYSVRVTLAGYTGEDSYLFVDGSTELWVQLTKTVADSFAPEESSTPEESSIPEESSTPEETTTPEISNEKNEYTINITRIGGLAVPNVTFLVYEGETLVNYGQTDANGIGTVFLKPSNNYSIMVSVSALKGYIAESRYYFTGTSANIVLKTSVIEDSDLTGVRYQLGDIMRDFTYITTDGKEFQLSEVLKTKKAVLINFWYSTCGPCVNEFPYMQSAYEKYQDDIAVIALNNYPADTLEDVKAFKQSMGLTFDVAKDYTSLGSAFNLSGYPTSIIVDRYGTICLIEVGGLTSEKPFVAAFDHFSADNYQQQLFQAIEELTPTDFARGDYFFFVNKSLFLLLLYHIFDMI